GPSPATTQNNAGHTETRKTGKMTRNSGKTTRKTGNVDAHTSENGDLNKPLQITSINNHTTAHAPAREDADGPDDVGGVGDPSMDDSGIGDLVGEAADAMALDSTYNTGTDTDPAELDSARRLLRALRAQAGGHLSPRAVRELTPVI